MSIGRIESAATKGEATIVLTWDDGRRAEIDLAQVIVARSVLGPLGDPEVFHRIRIANDGWTVEWPACGIDLRAAQLRRWADEQTSGGAEPDGSLEQKRKLDALVTALQATARSGEVEDRDPIDFPDRRGL
jgi:hypothetical protein